MLIDTLAIANDLKSGGYSQQQAETQARVWAKLLDDNIATRHDLKQSENALRLEMKAMESALRRDMAEMGANLKRDMVELETNLKRDMAQLETNLRHDMRELEYRLIIKLGSVIVVVMGLFTALGKLL